MKVSDIKIYKQADIIDLIDASDIDKDLISDIVSVFDIEAANGIKNNKVVKIPYVGNIRKSLYVEEFNKKKKLLHLARKYKTKEEYREFAREVAIESREAAEKRDRLGVLIRNARRVYKKQYEKLYITCGKSYAEMWVFCKCCFHIVPFDEDVEFALQEIWRKENEA